MKYVAILKLKIEAIKKWTDLCVHVIRTKWTLRSPEIFTVFFCDERIIYTEARFISRQ